MAVMPVRRATDADSSLYLHKTVGSNPVRAVWKRGITTTRHRSAPSRAATITTTTATAATGILLTSADAFRWR